MTAQTTEHEVAETRPRARTTEGGAKTRRKTMRCGAVRRDDEAKIDAKRCGAGRGEAVRGGAERGDDGARSDDAFRGGAARGAAERDLGYQL